MKTRVSVDDLLFAATWLEGYEGEDDDANNEAAARVAAWLRTEVDRREEAVIVSRLIKTTGLSRAKARAIYRRNLGRT